MATLGLAKIVLYSMDPETLSAFYAHAAGLSFDRVPGTRRYESMSPSGVAIIVDLAHQPLARGRRAFAR
jgi:hypothetical protein